MQDTEVRRAVAAAKSIASALGLTAADAIVLHNSNNLAVRLLPCDVFARIAPEARNPAAFEIELAQRLAAAQSPVAALEPRVAPRPYERDGFVVSLWTYYPAVLAPLAARDYAAALARLHAGLRQIDMERPRFTYRVAEAHKILADRARSPALSEDDRTLLLDALNGHAQAIANRGAPEQLLHGEPHPGNVLGAAEGPVFIDLETCCRGPVEFDLAHVPEDVAAYYSAADAELLGECRALVLAMVAAWRWDAADEFPNGRQWGHTFVSALRAGPPWPTLDAMTR